MCRFSTRDTGGPDDDKHALRRGVFATLATRMRGEEDLNKGVYTDNECSTVVADEGERLDSVDVSRCVGRV